VDEDAELGVVIPAWQRMGLDVPSPTGKMRRNRIASRLSNAATASILPHAAAIRINAARRYEILEICQISGMSANMAAASSSAQTGCGE
jgi:hypothetical protein